MRYALEPKDNFFQTHCSLPEKEIFPGVTVTFISLVDLTSVESIRARAVREGLERPSYTAFVLKALGMALKKFPYANRRVIRNRLLPFVGPRLQRFHDTDIGVAVERDTPGAESVAFVDVIRQSDKLDLWAINDWLRLLAGCDENNNEQWRQFSTIMRRYPYWFASFLTRIPRWLPSLWPKYRGGAALISSPGKYGVDKIAAAWAWPLGISFGYVKPRPVVIDGEVVPRTTFHLIMNFDRRIMAGAQAARFYARLIELLETAEDTLLEPDSPLPQPPMGGAQANSE